jgi:hypothetical protein
MRKGPGRNDPCPCGSGKKLKKCCRFFNPVGEQEMNVIDPTASKDVAGQPFEEKKLPAFAIFWDAEAQGVAFDFDPLQFKRWDFVLALLDMARQKAEFLKGQTQMAQAMQRQVEAQQAQRLLGRIGLGR